MNQPTAQPLPQPLPTSTDPRQLALFPEDWEESDRWYGSEPPETA